MGIAWCLIIIAALMASTPVLAKDKAEGPSIIKYSDGTVVRKGADGSIETYNPDGTLKAVSVQESGSGGGESERRSESTAPARVTSAPVVKRNLPNRHAGMRKINGVTVKVNTDGTVETYEPPESMGTLHPGGNSGKKPATHAHKAPAHK